jgi:hypothetical protein
MKGHKFVLMGMPMFRGAKLVSRKAGMVFPGGLVVVLAFALMMTGCTTVDTLNRENPKGGTFQDIKVPNKDFESKGIVFAEYKSEGDEAGNERGEVYTYYKLLQEAQKLGADAIVNVVIEAGVAGRTNKVFGVPKKAWMTKTTWYGSATAIKYTVTINQSEEQSVIVLGPDGKTIISEKGINKSTALATGTSSSSGIFSIAASDSGKKWWNPLTWFKK